MSKTEDYQIFHDIINYQNISPQISGFFENLRASAKNNTAAEIINTLNNMLPEKETLRICVRNKSQKEVLPVDLLPRYELLCRIFIIRWNALESRKEADYKKPMFSTFCRTFEHPSFYPDYWVEVPRERKNLKASVTSPVDSSTVFMQYLNNHISDGNWQKLACSKDRTASRMRQKELLEIEYAQCHYMPGDPDYPALEKQYRDLSARIDAGLNTDTIGGNTGMTPWVLRKILRSYVSIPRREETARWTWQKYCALKSAVNSASSEPQNQSFSTRNPFFAVPEKCCLKQIGDFKR